MKRREDGKWGDGGRGFHPIRMWHILAFAGFVFMSMGVSLVYRSIHHSLGFGGEVAPLNDENCHLLVTAHGPFSSEDFAEYEDGLFFVSAGDLAPTFGHAKDRGAKEGKIWVVDANTDSSDKLEKRLKAIKIDGLPPRTRIGFQPHGLYYSKKTNTLYAISHHAEKGGEKVFTFAASRVKGSKGVDSVKLKFERALSTEANAALHGVFNDVVEGTKKGEFYMTQLLPFPLPKKGVPESFDEHLHQAASYLSIFGPGSTAVHRCTFDPKKKGEKNEDVECEVVAGGFSLVNGITTNDDRDKYWVVDTRNVIALKRKADGSLERTGDSFAMPHMGDNIEWDSKTHDLYVGTIPNPISALAKMGKGLSHEGTLHVIHQDFGKMSRSEDLVVHSGEKLGSVSAGFVYKNKALLGSPFHSGVLVCEL
jgi:hypothetical protein